jgi:hypothetical protein
VSNLEGILKILTVGWEKCFLMQDSGKSRWTKDSRHLFTTSIYNKTVRGAISKTVSLTKNIIKKNLKKFI